MHHNYPKESENMLFLCIIFIFFLNRFSLANPQALSLHVAAFFLVAKHRRRDQNHVSLILL